MKLSEVIKTYCNKTNTSYYKIDKTLDIGHGASASLARQANPRAGTLIRTLQVMGYRVAIVDSSDRVVDTIELDN